MVDWRFLLLIIGVVAWAGFALLAFWRGDGVSSLLGSIACMSLVFAFCRGYRS